MIEFTAFSDELEKIAEESAQGSTRPHPPMNKDVIKQHIINAGLISAGAGLGYGASRLLKSKLKSIKGSRGDKWRRAVAVGLPAIGGLTAALGPKILGEMKRKSLDKAYKEGQERGE